MLKRVAKLAEEIFTAGYNCGYVDGMARNNGMPALSFKSLESWDRVAYQELLALLDGEPVGDPYEGIKQHNFGGNYRCLDCGTTVDDAPDQFCKPKYLPGYPKTTSPQPSREREALERDHRAMQRLRHDCTTGCLPMLKWDAHHTFHGDKGWRYNQAGVTCNDPADAILSESEVDHE
jgi:hypothetical protein